VNADTPSPELDGVAPVDLGTWEPGQDVDADALVAAELAALRTLATAAAITVEEVALWAGTTDPDQLEQIIAAIPFSSIPDALAEIAQSVADADGHRSG